MFLDVFRSKKVSACAGGDSNPNFENYELFHATQVAIADNPVISQHLAVRGIEKRANASLVAIDIETQTQTQTQTQTHRRL